MAKNNWFIGLFLFLIAILALFVIAEFSGVTDVGLKSPANASYDSDGSVTFIFNATGNVSLPDGYSCTLYWNATGSWAATTNTNSNATNNTAENVTESGISNGHILWNIGCNSVYNSTVVFASTNNYTIIVDTVAPNVTINSPKDSSWNNGTFVLFNVTVRDANPDSCLLHTNLNATSNSSGTFNNSVQTLTYLNNVSTNFTYGWNSVHVAWTENNTGSYRFMVACNDSAGNWGTNSNGNFTFFVDRTGPTQPNLTSPVNNTKSTDMTPVLNWIASRDLNFSKYVLWIDDDANFASAYYQRNITANGTNISLVTTALSKDVDYFWRVSAVDLAGNQVNSSTTFTYRTDRWCSLLTAGWNVCAWTETIARNASSICDDVGCSYVAKYNASHEFQTYTTGSATNDEMQFNASNTTNPSLSLSGYTDSVIFIYVNSNTSWENRTWMVDQSYIYVNITNTSTGWNLVPILNQTTTFNFGKIDRSLNGNGTSFLLGNQSFFMSYFSAENITGSKYIPYVANRSINNATVLRYGSAVWIHMNKSRDGFNWSSNGEIS